MGHDYLIQNVSTINHKGSCRRLGHLVLEIIIVFHYPQNIHLSCIDCIDTLKNITQDGLVTYLLIVSDHNVKVTSHFFQTLVRQCPVIDKQLFPALGTWHQLGQIKKSKGLNSP